MALDKSQIRPTSIMNKAFENELPSGDFAVKASLMVIMPPSTCTGEPTFSPLFTTNVGWLLAGCPSSKNTHHDATE
jgi:hypothetical protein